jgi:MFS family permease
MLKDLPQNTRATLLFNLLSSPVASFLFFYATLYMQGVGLTAPQIGLIASLASVTGFVMQAMAAPVVNRMGRKRSLLVFSLLCWSFPLFLWMLATGFTLFLLAALFYSISRITAIAWYCVLTEGVPERQKPKVFGIQYIFGSVGGLATLLAGPVMDQFGLVPAMRVLYGVACVSMTAMFLIRHRLLTESEAGIEQQRRHGSLSLLASVRHHVETVKQNVANREFRSLTAVYVLFAFAGAMDFVTILFLNNVLHLTVTQLSLLPPLTAVISILLYRIALKHVHAANECVILVLSVVGIAISKVLLLVIPAGNPWWMLVVSGLGATGGYLFSVAISAALNNRMGAAHVADAYSAVQLLTALFSIPAGYLAGALYGYRPGLAILATGAVMVAAAFPLLRKRAVPA